MQNPITTFWQHFTTRRKEFEQTPLPRLDHFCNDEESANLCAQLVNDGIKTATCSAKVLYGFDKEEIPAVGTLSIITDWSGNPVCVIRTTKVEFKKFQDIDATWARKEGDGDFSLQDWQREHEKFFRAALSPYGIPFQKDLILVCEEFEKL